MIGNSEMAARNRIDLVEKTLRVLEALAHAKRPAALGELAAEVGLVKSSLFRILYTLKQVGYVEQAEGKGPYRLTGKLAELVGGAAARPTLIEAALPLLNRLRDKVSEGVWLAELRQGEVVLVHEAESPQRLRLSYNVGDRAPLHATAVGKAIAAHLPAGELSRLLGRRKLPRFTAYTIAARARLRAELERVRRLGYAINNEETVEGAIVFGAPVLEASGRPVAAVSVGVPTVRCTPEKRRAVIEAVKLTAAALSGKLAGYSSTMR